MKLQQYKLGKINRRVFVERLMKVGTNAMIFHLLKNNPTACFIYFLIS